MVDVETEEAVARERRAWPRFFAAAAAVIVIAVMAPELSTRRTFHPWPVGVSAGLVMGFLLLALWAHRRIPQRVKAVRQRGEQRKRDGLATLYAAEADRKRLIASCNERISEADRLEEFVKSIALPDLRREVADQQSGKRVPLADPSAQAPVASSYLRGSGRVLPPFKLAEWSLEPVGTDKT